MLVDFTPIRSRDLWSSDGVVCLFDNGGVNNSGGGVLTLGDEPNGVPIHLETRDIRFLDTGTAIPSQTSVPRIRTYRGGGEGGRCGGWGCLSSFIQFQVDVSGFHAAVCYIHPLFSV